MKTDVLFFVDETVTDDKMNFTGKPACELVAQKLSGVDGIDSIRYSLPQSYSGLLNARENAAARDGNDDIRFWKDIFSQTKADHIIKIYADAPFVDPAIVSEMLTIHIDNLAEFTFSENLPDGLGCEIMAKELVESVPDFGEETLPVSKVVKSNINQFDIELYYKDPDLRDKRLSFLSRFERDKKVMENIERENSTIPGYVKIKEIIDANPGVLFIGPSYVELELAGNCELDCVFCYRNSLPEYHGDMEPQLVEKILADMRIFNLPYTVCLGGSGEPLQHPAFYSVLDALAEEELVERIIIETNGIHADSNYKQAVEKYSHVITIVNINGHTQETYKARHAGDYFDTVLANVRLLKNIPNSQDQERVFVQILKINETESYLDEYYNFFEQEKISIILQKQNIFLGKVTDRRYSDLSPLERTPCCHLQRDLYILADGTVGFCKQDIDGEYSVGNIHNDSIEEIWKKKEADFKADYAKKYATQPNCKDCDEWYTFNF